MSSAVPSPARPPSRVAAAFERVLVERGVKGLYHRLLGRRYRMKAEAAIEEIQAAVDLLNPRTDRVGLSGFDDAYRTYLAPTRDHHRVGPALRQVWRSVTDPRPRGSRLFHAIGELEDAFYAHSPDRVLAGLVLTDGGDNAGASGEEAGLRSQAFMAAAPGRRHVEVVGVGRDQAVDYGALGRYAKVGQLTMLDGVAGLGAVVRRTLYRAVARVTGAAAAEVGDVSVRMLTATLAVERVGIDLVFLVDTSPSMARFEVTLPDPDET